MTMIQDGTGNGSWLKVDDNKQGHVFSLTRTATQDATRKGNSHNINTGTIALTSSTESGVLYFKNDESPVNGESSFIIDAIEIGIDSAGTNASMTHITTVKNPTTGTLVSGESAVAMKENRNFGSSNTLSPTTLVYKGAEGSTVTNGEDVALFYQTAGTRRYYPVDLEIPKGSSLAIKMDTQTSSGTTNVYAAIIGHRVDGKNS